ncbi:TetR family transcriptional regulator [Paenibacillus sp. P32E]|uniref:acyl-CoA-like ligand-binding transcription factor n=1 Tax=Paenibacillus sp. P32E TaxID=1349434 RepID=UPI0015BEF47C|nr:TetR family transcriptional regulator [Paenibacillus sp. P32E]
MLIDNYDPLFVAAFEDQPSNLSPLQAIRNAMLSGIKDMSTDELTTVRERNELIMKVPELRAASLNNMTQMMQLIMELIAKRVGRNPEDLAVRTFAGAIIGVNISVMLYYAENPDADFATLLDEALSKLEEGLPL